LDRSHAGSNRRTFQYAKEQIMRQQLLAISAILAAMSAPIAAQAQSDTVGVRGGAVVVDENGGIAVDQRPAFREYVIRERVPNYSIPDRVIVGGVLPETGVTYYDVPQTFGATPFRYTVVNGRTVLVEPRTRRIVQVIE
jgi:non-ribosomal peptide synthetase component E (peptide arylation enzyme)